MGSHTTYPFSLEAERMLLSQLMQEPALLDHVRDRLKEGHWHRVEHGLLYVWLCRLWRQEPELLGEGMVLLPRRLDGLDALHTESNGAEGVAIERLGGIGYVMELPTLAPSTANWEHYAGVVIDLWRKREVMAAGEDLARAMAMDQPVEEALAAFTARADGATRDTTSGDAMWMGDPAFHTALDDGYTRTEARLAGQLVPGLSYSSDELDAMTGGARPGQVIVLAARPGVGKTLRAQQHAERWASAGTGVAFYTTEMSKQELLERWVVQVAGRVRDYGANMRGMATQMRDGFDSIELAESLIEAARKHLATLPICIVEAAGLNMEQIEADYRGRHARGEVGAFIVDYVQNLDPIDKRDGRERQVARTSQLCKKIAQRLNSIGLVLSQLNRSAEGVEPSLAHLRESGAIEQDADVIMLMWQPWMWAEDIEEVPREERYKAWVAVAKARGGAKGRVPLRFWPEVLRFERWQAPA